MGYRKVYLTIEEEEDIARIKAWREKEEREGSAFNAILKEGLGMVMAKELDLRNRAKAEEVVATTVSSSRRSRRRRGVPRDA